MARLDPSSRVRNHITDILADGPIRFEELCTALIRRGLQLGPEPDDRVDAVMASMAQVAWLTVENPADGDPADHGFYPEALMSIVYDRRAILNGTTWTVPINELDIASDTLPSSALGLAFIALLNRWVQLDGVGAVSTDSDGRRRTTAADLGLDSHAEMALVFPPGWLSNLGAVPGGYVQFSVKGELMHARATDHAPEPTDAMVVALIDALTGEMDAEPDYEGSCGQIGVLTRLLVTHEELRATTFPPLQDWLDATGLAHNGSSIAPAGFDLEREALTDQIADAIALAGLSSQHAARFTTLMEVWHRWLADPDQLDPLPTEVLTNALTALAAIPVTAAFVDTAYDPDHADELVAFGERLIDLASVRQKAWPAWVVAQTLGRAGEADLFEDWLDAALMFDDEHLLSLFDKAWFEFDRGELRKSKALMNRIGMPADSHDMELIDSILGASDVRVGRNDPCPCGSGRKYKRCHLGVDEIPLNARLTLLYRKANRWLEYRHSREVHMLAMVRAGHGDMSPRQMLETDPLIPDSVLVEGGRMAEWVTERGALLPSDEAMLASQWSLIERSVFEVTEVRHDEGMTIRDVRTGDILDVDERRGTHGMKVGTYILARPLPVGDDTLQFFGGLVIIPDPALHSFIDLLDSRPSPVQLLSLVARTEAPPELRNTSLEELVFTEMTWQVADESAAHEVLDEIFEPVDGSKWSWLAEPDAMTTSTSTGAPTGSVADEHGADQTVADHRGAHQSGGQPPHLDQGRTVLGEISLDSDRLTISVNSIERAERVNAIITDALPDAVLVEELRSSMDDLRDDQDYEEYIFADATDMDDGTDIDGVTPGSGLIDPSQLSPEMKAALRQHMDLQEERWVDESIPALGGATPRQALDDPTRRDDLMRLLDRMESMEAHLPVDGAGLEMRTSRLRELLGL